MNDIFEVTVDRTNPMVDSIRAFAKSYGLPIMKDDIVDYEKDGECCFMTSQVLTKDLEIGYFKLRLNRTLRIVYLENDEEDWIGITLNLGATMDQEVVRHVEVTKEGITNSILINNTKIKSVTTVLRNKLLHLFVLRYSKSFLRDHFYMATNFLSTVVNETGAVMVYADLNEQILNTMRAMEKGRFLEVTRVPYLIGKSYVLMAQIIEVIELRKSNSTLRMNSNEFQKLLEAKKYILRDWKRPPTIQQVSKFLGMSPTKAKGLFKLLYGLPIYTFFQQKRMAEALKLINEAELTITEIGQKLGYKNMGHFADSFKKQYGILPKKLSVSQKRNVFDQ